MSIPRPHQTIDFATNRALVPKPSFRLRSRPCRNASFVLASGRTAVWYQSQKDRFGWIPAYPLRDKRQGDADAA